MITIYWNTVSEEWHLGKNTPKAPENITVICADGEELGFILSQFNGIPKPSYASIRSFKWYGSDAKTIMGNIANICQ